MKKWTRMVKGEDARKNHRMRNIVLNYIKANPGVSFKSIREMMEMNESTLRYHLKYLERNESVYSKKDGKFRCYYPKEVGRNVADSSIEDRLTKVQKRILYIIEGSSGITYRELFEILTLKKDQIRYNLNRLVELNLIWKVRIGGEIGFEVITEKEIKKEMVRKLIEKLLNDEIDERTFHTIRKRLE